MVERSRDHESLKTAYGRIHRQLLIAVVYIERKTQKDKYSVAADREGCGVVEGGGLVEYLNKPLKNSNNPMINKSGCLSVPHPFGRTEYPMQASPGRQRVRLEREQGWQDGDEEGGWRRMRGGGGGG